MEYTELLIAVAFILMDKGYGYVLSPIDERIIWCEYLDGNFESLEEMVDDYLEYNYAS